MNLDKIEGLVTAALRRHAEAFDAAVAEARRGAAMPDQQKPPVTQTDGSILIDITPTPQGFAMMGGVFATEAKNARKLAEEIERRGLRAICQHGVEDVEDNQDAINRSIAEHERHLASLDEDGQPIRS